MVHDLSARNVDEVEALLRREAKVCVRARIGADGVIATGAGGAPARRIRLAAGAMAGLIAAGQPAIAKDARVEGSIAGTLDGSSFEARVVATAADGRVFRTKASLNRRYRIKHLPPGVYTLTFVPDCGDPWSVTGVRVGAGEMVVRDEHDPNECIVVGMIEADLPRG